MFKAFLSRLILVFVLCCSFSVDAREVRPNLFLTQEQAQQHCPADVVVWLNLPSGIYHYQGERWYGRTKHGVYVCKEEADEAGDRATRNGQ